jgi:hypothetical protein
MLTTITISRAYWHYHKTILGEVGEWEVVKYTNLLVTIELDEVALDELKFSATRVLDPNFTDMSEPEGRAEVQRAKRVLNAIAKTEKKVAA